MDLTRRIRDKMMNERLMFVYRGIVTDENSVPLLVLLEKEMEESDFGFLGKKRLFMFVLESLQNVSRHSPKSLHSDMSMVVFSRTDKGYTVTTGNVINTMNIEDLKVRLEVITNLDPDEIRSVYRKMLSSAEISNKGGAGLGLIEMARKTGNQIDYDFVYLNDDFSYFVLSKTIDSEGAGFRFSFDGKTFDGNKIVQLEKIMAEKNIYLIWQGHISPDIGREVLSFTETKMAEDDAGSLIRKRVFSIMVEMLENVLWYSPGKEASELYGMPVVLLRIEKQSYFLTTGNLMLRKDVDSLRQKIDMVNTNDREALKSMFRKSLSEQTIASDSTGNMGLIDIARKSGYPLEYQFEDINDIYSYYTLTVRVDDENY